MVRVLELYCGIGGCSAALARGGLKDAEVSAVDVSRPALEVYGHLFPGHSRQVRLIEGMPDKDLTAFEADLWWLSPPCQPFTRRGLHRDDEDPRSKSLLSLIDRWADVGPPLLALENVPGFAGSRTHARLTAALARGGYRTAERVLCPTELGIPNRRRRYYLTAARSASGRSGRAPRSEALAALTSLGPPRAPETRGAPLASYLDPCPASDRGTEPDPALAVDPDIARRYPHALHIVDPDDPAAVSACFTSAYGRSHVRSGSYLVEKRAQPTAAGTPALRRFSPAEILRLLGFPSSLSLPPDLPTATAYRLLGNSLSVHAVQTVLAGLPALAD